jgi:hypothetical protein
MFEPDCDANKKVRVHATSGSAERVFSRPVGHSIASDGL